MLRRQQRANLRPKSLDPVSEVARKHAQTIIDLVEYVDHLIAYLSTAAPAQMGIQIIHQTRTEADAAH